MPVCEEEESTVVFTEGSVPDGSLRLHHGSLGVWAILVCRLDC